MQEVVVTTSAFGNTAVLENGQAFYIPLIAKSGAQGVEIRRELLQDSDDSILQIRRVLDNTSLLVVYSAPVAIWREDGTCNLEEMQAVTQEAKQLGASIVKFCLGNYKPEQCDVSALQPYLVQAGFDGESFVFTVENDQTAHGGTLKPLAAFLSKCRQQEMPVYMTFDIGNWRWSGEDARKALDALLSHVMYVHCKHVTRDMGKLVTIPPPEDDGAEWKHLLEMLPDTIPKAIEFPLAGEDLQAVTTRYVTLLQQELCKHSEV